jgi:hypothetical protein
MQWWPEPQKAGLGQGASGTLLQLHNLIRMLNTINLCITQNRGQQEFFVLIFVISTMLHADLSQGAGTRSPSEATVQRKCESLCSYNFPSMLHLHLTSGVGIIGSCAVAVSRDLVSLHFKNVGVNTLHMLSHIWLALSMLSETKLTVAR